MALVIGIHGAKNSGKNLFYNVVKDSFPDLEIRRIAYADPIRAEICNIFNLSSEADYDLFKRSIIKYYDTSIDAREVVRGIGMLMRQYDERQFVRYVENEITKHPNAIWCITDLRFKNEIRSIKRLADGVIVKVLRNSAAYDGHESETEIPDKLCDIIIDNNSTYDDYKQNIIIEFSKLLQRGSFNTFK